MTLAGKKCSWARGAIVAAFLVTAPLVSGQTPVETNSPKLGEPFTFTLSPQHDYALSAVTKSIEQHDEILRAKELDEAHASIFSKAVELLRYIPIKLSGSDPEDFFAPNYLRQGDVGIPPAVGLFDKR